MTEARAVREGDSSAQTVVPLLPEQFGESERTLLRAGELSASGFRFESGVAGLRLRNELGEVVMLPFQGQQIWSASFHGRELTMRSMFDQPRATRAYLETYGGFLLHCGATAMGVPGPEDDHPLHGELPNAPYASAYLVLAEDERGRYLGLGGRYRHTVAFACDYLAKPMVRLYSGGTVLGVAIEIENLKSSPMELMYLAHINFRPVDRGRLAYTAKVAPESVRVRRTVPSHVRPGPGYREFLEELAREPDRHHRLDPGLAFDPEVAFSIDYLADKEGWAHSLQVHPDGAADYVAHRPDELEKGIRWICRTPDQDALGLVLPATAEPEGYAAERAKGNIKTLPGAASFRCRMLLGALTPDEARSVEARIEAIVAE
ncbi:MAG: DUF4432 family protein [Trueperaceae bacterium]